jgi:putative sigma-54 modulation protein
VDIQLRTQEIEIPRNGVRDLSRRLADRFSGMAFRIARLHVTLKDVNGPRGGLDKVCILRAELAGGGEILVRDRSSHLRRAIDRCARRLKHAVGRETRRRKSRMRHGRFLGVPADLPTV